MYALFEAVDDVFFVETSGNFLNLRQACSIESAAIHHSQSSIKVMILKDTDVAYGLTKMYPNIKVNRIHLNDTFEGTPLKTWFRSKQWATSIFRTNDISDALRIVLIREFGGIYLDLDVVVLKPLYNINNFAIMQDKATVNNAIFRFDQGHNFLYKCLQNLEKSYMKNIWGSIGPNLFTKTVKDYCKIHSFRNLSALNCDMDVQPENAGYPIPYYKWKEYFRPPTPKNKHILKESYVIHVWNAKSKNEMLRIGSGSIYENAMKENCPFIYEKLKNEN
ncbi:lactosylceramide 4-alpha-galactosyltransferase-like [Centruroides sculpturatus]|uniref:lactosylceramide 4-alpha-galactosyltransferase-like n=1 Tax=Centruroides sculpturatus TaxID=218467 RepID=UPI000C6DCF11|nr:lactosylceramide 4-alpha-galactosyltransferase-like [Centruroides sculpturatus]